MNHSLQRAQKIMRWMVVGYLALSGFCAIVSALIMLRPHVGNAHNGGLGLVLLATVPGTVIYLILASLTNWARRRIGHGTDADARFALGINATVAVLSLLIGHWPATAAHGWVALLISRELNLTNTPTGLPGPLSAVLSATPIEPGTRVERRLPGINWTTAMLIASGFVLAAVAVLVLCFQVGLNRGPLLLAPILLLVGGAFYFHFVKRCPQCRTPLRYRREMIAGTTRYRALHDCAKCQVTWDSGVVGDQKNDGPVGP
ncbi:MAG: hypothetical protein EBS84_20690 [Proteobacteria bacterium]|nr:hypothetical protein [Verrucomicrobiota bacterium]NBU11394.1 hypothetical protein [Pseudomonadota bacterium]